MTPVWKVVSYIAIGVVGIVFGAMGGVIYALKQKVKDIADYTRLDNELELMKQGRLKIGK